MNIFWVIVAKAAIVHTLTYFLVGFSAFNLFNYAATLSHPDTNFRPANDPLVRAGALFQPIRGILFGVIFYLLRSVIFQANGWIILWAMLVILGIFSTFAPAGYSIEGLIYLKRGAGANWGGLVEILLQSFLLSTVTYYWVTHPGATWLDWLIGILFVVSLLLPLLGLVASRKNKEN
ncbi:MAG TPA: hypothetical protein VMU27_00445 [Candidatus Paceibacterota bacterium]|nr:hypothetical protein [Candidatus Paceibacterota bacterium]